LVAPPGIARGERALTNFERFLLTLLQPSTFLTASSILGAVLLAISQRARLLRRIGATILGVGIIGFAMVLLLPVDDWLLRPLEDRFPPVALSHIDGVVVLGGSVSETVSADRGTPSLNRDADRLVAFAALAHAWPDARLVFAGGPSVPTRGSLTEAEASRRILEQLGVPPGRVLYDDRSETTWGNALNSLVLAKPKPGETWVLVTSASHMPRAMGAFRAAGWPAPQAWPVAYRTTKTGWRRPLQPMGTKLAAIDLAAHEWAGLAGYRLKGRTESLFPAP
jgi:uncharacterized SAM-binding protein YcdF (DUF218 family)